MAQENMNTLAILQELESLRETGSAKLRGNDLFTRREENCDLLFVGTVADEEQAQATIEEFYRG